MARPLVILCADTGLASCGLARLECHGREVVVQALEVIRTSPTPSRATGLDEDMRMREVHAGMERVRGGVKVDVVAYETYRPWKPADGVHRAAHGRLVAMGVGLVVGYALAIGAATVPVDPSEPKRLLGVPDKGAVAAALEARIDGLTELLDRAGRRGDHGSDAVGVGMAAMIKIFNQARKR